MKIMIASDIHGSAYYCRKTLEAFSSEGAERLFLLGDILYHGPRNDLPRDYAPKEVVKMLNPMKDRLLAVRGNCDAEIDQTVLDFPIMADYALLFHADRMFFFTHGHIFNKENMPSLSDGDFLIHGHTHVPAWESLESGRFMYINPGSVSIPKEESRHSYLTLTDRKFEWKDVETGDVWHAFDF
ncbi:MAG: phosphodiesterase [Oscillospiraceae bacterium]